MRERGDSVLSEIITVIFVRWECLREKSATWKASLMSPELTFFVANRASRKDGGSVIC